jgi:transposase
MKFPITTNVYLWQGVCDMRCSFDRLASLVKEKLTRNSITGNEVYVFFSRCRRKVKLLYWDRDGYAIWHKRLEAGSYKVEKLERCEVITEIDLNDLLSGIDFSRINLRKNAEKGSFNQYESATL